ncbi:MAG: ribosome maturation factor RimP [Propionibacteriaceae bacterium]|nr:ribosome maturation factor RimP [Propionibacteriaceae bacterium]
MHAVRSRPRRYRLNSTRQLHRTIASRQLHRGGRSVEPATVTSLVAPVVASCGLEVDRVDVLPAGKRRVVRIFLDGDGPEGRGPSLDEIADATRAISKVLDDAPAMGSQPWTLEVSSRGVSRPLTEEKHFRRNVGRLVALTTESERLTGRIVAVADGRLTLDVEGEQRTVPLQQIDKAQVKLELNRSLDDEQE